MYTHSDIAYRLYMYTVCSTKVIIITWYKKHGLCISPCFTELYILLLPSFASREAAMAMCNDLGGMLPVLDSEEDMNLFHAETSYINLIYLGATSNHNPASRDHYTWTDQSHFNFLTDVVGTYAPQAEIYSEATLIRRIAFLNVSDSDKCVALVYFPLLPSQRVISLPCNVPFNVSLYCSGQTRLNNSEYNTLSTMHIDIAENNFTMIKKGPFCSNDDDSIHWFQQDNVCLRVKKCHIKSVRSFQSFNKCCQLNQLYVFQSDDIQTRNIHDSSVVGRFLSLFKARFTARRKKSWQSVATELSSDILQ